MGSLEAVANQEVEETLVQEAMMVLQVVLEVLAKEERLGQVELQDRLDNVVLMDLQVLQDYQERLVNVEKQEQQAHQELLVREGNLDHKAHKVH